MGQFVRHVSAIDTNTGGQPLRILTSVPEIPRESSLRETYERLRTSESALALHHFVMHEPRGHHGMVGCIVLPPFSPSAELAVLFLDNQDYAPVSSHGLAGLVTALAETGRIQKADSVTVETLAGPLHARVDYDAEAFAVNSVRFTGVPSFVYQENVQVRVGDKTVSCDVLFSGAFYAVFRAADLATELITRNTPRLQQLGHELQQAASTACPVRHPEDDPAIPLFHDIYGVVIVDDTSLIGADPIDAHTVEASSDKTVKLVTVFADAQIDRCPSDTGIAAWLAIASHRGTAQRGAWIAFEGLSGARVMGRVAKSTTLAQYAAIVPEVSGTSFVTGMMQFVLDPSDPLSSGFLLRG